MKFTPPVVRAGFLRLFTLFVTDLFRLVETTELPQCLHVFDRG